MNPDRAADLAVLAATPLPDGRDVLIRAADDGVQVLGHVPGGATVHLDGREMQGGWLDLPDETAEAVVAALTRVATDPQFAGEGPEVSLHRAQSVAATLHVDDDAEIPSEWRRIAEAEDAYSPQDRAAAAVTWDAASRASTIALQTGNTVDDSIAEAAFTDARIAASSLGPRGTVGVSRGFGAAPGASNEGRSDVARRLGHVNVDRLREVVRIRTEVEPPAPRRSDRYDVSERPTPQQGMER